MLKPSE